MRASRSLKHTAGTAGLALMVLGAHAPASAGVTWYGANPSNPAYESGVILDLNFGTGYLRESGAPGLLAQQASIGSDTASVTAAGPNGFSVALSNPGGGITDFDIGVERWFTLSASTQVTFTWSATGASFSFPSAVLRNSSYQEVHNFLTGPSSTTLTAGTYSFSLNLMYFAGFNSGAPAPNLGTFANFYIVPAPGAAALLAMAGLTGSRRRRA